MIPCIIPARGKSKGIPRKNVVLVGGKPLIAWSIEQALAAREVDRVIVATDDNEIADVARDCGAAVYWRSQESATDNAPSEMVLQEVIASQGLSECEAIVFLQATSPIRQQGEIDAVCKWMRRGSVDSVFSARKIEGYTWSGGIPDFTNRLPRQSRGERHEENGSIYAFRPNVIEQYGNRLGGKVGIFEMHPLDSFQIDEPSDIALIESLMEIRCDSHARA